jgi:DNA polymerase-3 subunit delta
MKLHPDQLASHLGGRLAPIYLLSGDEPLQLMEAADAIRDAARAAGFNHREVFYGEPGFDWSQLTEAGDSFSLFGNPRLLDLRLSGKPDKPGSAALMHYADHPPEDAILLVTLPKLTANDQKSTWLKALESRGVFMQFWPLDSTRLLRWLDRRLNARGLLADQSGLRLIAARVEGNLLAAAQEVEKLHILHGHGQLSDDQILKSVADSARYDVFDLVDEVLRGHLGKVTRILSALKAEGVAAPIVLWALSREIRLIHTLKTEIGAGATPDSVFSKHRLWDRRKQAISRALQRLSQEKLFQALQLAGRTDRIIKGIEGGDEWDTLLFLCQNLVGRPT